MPMVEVSNGGTTEVKIPVIYGVRGTTYIDLDATDFSNLFVEKLRVTTSLANASHIYIYNRTGGSSTLIQEWAQSEQWMSGEKVLNWNIDVSNMTDVRVQYSYGGNYNNLQIENVVLS